MYDYSLRTTSSVSIYAIMILLMFVGITGQSAVEAGSELKTFEGAWFKIDHPADFTVKTSLPSITADGYDSAFFVSPDRQVIFYICSPQWAREPADIQLQPEREKLVAKEVKKADQKEVTYITIAAQDESYRRSYQDTTAQDGAVRWVIGIQYKDKSAFETYKSAYLKFKQSLVQFAD